MATDAVHIAGARDIPMKQRGYVTVDDDGIRFADSLKKNRPPLLDASWSDVVSIEIAGSNEVANTKAANVLAFGALGLLSNGDKKRSYMVVALADGQTPAFEVHGMTPFEATARLKTNASAAQRLVEASATHGEGGSIDSLERLADLHRAGDLTDEEFTAAKRRMLGL